jgi:hypothetical protein
MGIAKGAGCTNRNSGVLSMYAQTRQGLPLDAAMRAFDRTAVQDALRKLTFERSTRT